jgi:catechol 2,3-dioxygenase-like lactoylglutathione lyase family enzyme
MTVEGLKAFHVAIVTRDLDEAIKRYTKVLGVERWHHWGRSPIRMAYGAGAGMTFEVFGINGEGNTMFDEFLRVNGEGVQHIGFWCPDVRAAVRDALEAGGQIVSGVVNKDGTAAVQVSSANFDAFDLRNPVFVNAGIGFTIEYFGPGGEQLHKDWFKEDYDKMVVAPPWA